MIKFVTTGVAMFAMSGLFAADTLKIKDSSATVVKKAPKGSPIAAFETASKFSSSATINFAAPGVTGVQFSAQSVVKISIQDISTSSDSTEVEFKFGDDPKYKAGGASVKYVKKFAPVPIPGHFNDLYTVTVKIAKDKISLVYTSKLGPVFAQSYINYGSIPNGVKFRKENRCTRKKFRRPSMWAR